MFSPVDSWASARHAYFDLRVLGLFSPQVSPVHLVLKTLQGTAESVDDCNFFGVLELHVIPIDEINALSFLALSNFGFSVDQCSFSSR